MTNSHHASATLALSVVKTFLAFFAWHFALRRIGIRLPVRESARIYASLAGAVHAAQLRWWPARLVLTLSTLGASWLWWVMRPSAGPLQRGHFDRLAPDYADQLSSTARQRVVARKSQLTVEALDARGVQPGARLLDAGCGHGWYVDALSKRGYAVVGADLSPGQLGVAARELRMSAAHAHAATPFDRHWAQTASRLTAGSIHELPVRAGSFDGAYAVNVLHHVGDRTAQAHALAELARAVRPGGTVLLHEINTINPLHRFYMVYVFPLWKRIDLGTEYWLDARQLPRAHGLRLEEVHYYTFLPDFTPRWLCRALAPLEARLERSPAAALSAHFTAVYRSISPSD
jgi:SAM-dependent methyltransferase